VCCPAKKVPSEKFKTGFLLKGLKGGRNTFEGLPKYPPETTGKIMGREIERGERLLE